MVNEDIMNKGSEICEEHNKFVLYYCLDQRCKKNPSCCVICIKNEHNKCKDEMIIESEVARDTINLIKSDLDPTFITSKLNQIFELKLYEMQKTLMTKKSSFINSFNIQDSPQNILDKNALPEIKKNFNFDFNEESKKIDITSKFNATEEEINESVTTFEKSLEKKILVFLDEFSKLKFYIKGQMSCEDWIGHQNLEITDVSEGVHFSRKPEDATFNYFCSMYTIPLDTPCTFKVNVESIYETDRFVDVGIMPKSKFDSTKNGFVNSYNSGGISYCGYSIGGGLSGTHPTTTASSADGLKPGSHFYFHYEPGVEIKYYDDDNKINLKCDMTSKTGEYYLFAVVYHPQTKYYIEKID